MASSEQPKDKASLWNDDMPWGFYARRLKLLEAAKAEAESGLKPEVAPVELKEDAVPPEVIEDDDTRGNHAEYKGRSW
jgi:hypothetical protein